jgi:ATP synthase F1 gamma subunit
MSTKKEITDEIELIDTMGMIVQTFQEISVMKMQAVRKSVLQSRNFLDELANVFGDVNDSYRNQIQRMIEKNKKLTDEASLLNKNGKTVSILISTNSKLYGDITFKVSELFNENVSNNNDDIIIVGKLGKELYEQSGKKIRSYKFYEIADKDLEIEAFDQIVSEIVNYNKINVYYGKFESIVVQEPTEKNITGNEEDRQIRNSTEKIRYLFEPSLKRVFQFFETQVFDAIFKQTVNEAQLAAHASRIKSMEESLTHIEQEKGAFKILERQANRDNYNIKQQEMLTGISLWFK